MIKVYLNNGNHCACCEEEVNIAFFLNILQVENIIEVTENVKEADYLIYPGTCIGAFYTIENTLEQIKNGLVHKKKSAEILVCGCITKLQKQNFELLKKAHSILQQVTCYNSKEVYNIIHHLVGKEAPEEELVNEYSYTNYNHIANIHIVKGCKYKCSFCEMNYKEASTESIPFHQVKSMIEKNVANGYKQLNLSSTSINLYGQDLVQKESLIDVIEVAVKKGISTISIGAFANLTDEMIDYIIHTPNIKNIFLSLETGSKSLFKLMNRPYTFERRMEELKILTEKRPDMLISSEIISGFPRETKQDRIKTVECIRKFKLYIYPKDIHPYIDSPAIPSHNHFQYSTRHIYNSTLDYYRRLANHFIEQNQRAASISMLLNEETPDNYEFILPNGRAIYEPKKIFKQLKIKPKLGDFCYYRG